MTEENNIRIRVSYQLNTLKLKKLEEEGIPQDVLSQLQGNIGLLEGIEHSFSRDDAFISQVKAIIGEQATGLYRKIILQYARNARAFIDLPFSYLPLTVDILLRWLLFWSLKTDYVNATGFIIGQFVVMIAVFGAAFARDGKIKERVRSEVKQHDDGILSNIYVNLRGDVWSVLFSIFSIIAVAYTFYNSLPAVWHDNPWLYLLKIILFLVCFLLYTFYVIGVYMSSPKYYSIFEIEKQEAAISDTKELTPSVEGDIEQQTEKIIKEEEVSHLVEREIDDNDIKLTRLEVKTASMSQRVDTYTLESALFAALAFSGFLTLFTSDTTIVGKVELFLSTIGKVFLLELPINEFSSIMLNKANVEAMLIIETLVCSLFFIFVIVTRLRFTRLLEHIKYEIKEGRVYNAKEEDVYALTLDKNEGNIYTPNIINRRLENLNRKIVKNIDQANELLPEFKSILDWMKVCRDIGIGTFITILITSALLMSNILALIFIILSILAYTYTTLDDFLKNKKRNITNPSQHEQKD